MVANVPEIGECAKGRAHQNLTTYLYVFLTNPFRKLMTNTIEPDRRLYKLLVYLDRFAKNPYLK